jgi:hypothetical protein
MLLPERMALRKQTTVARTATIMRQMKKMTRRWSWVVKTRTRGARKCAIKRKRLHLGMAFRFTRLSA